MCSAERTIFLCLHTIGMIFLVLCRIVVSVLAFSASKCDFCSHITSAIFDVLPKYFLHLLLRPMSTFFLNKSFNFLSFRADFFSFRNVFRIFNIPQSSRQNPLKIRLFLFYCLRNKKRAFALCLLNISQPAYQVNDYFSKLPLRATIFFIIYLFRL